MMLPSENVLDVLHCVDFATLLALQRAGSAFYDVVHRNLTILPRLRVFEFYLDCAMDVLKLHETDEDGWGTVLRLPEDEGLVPYSAEVDYSALRTVHDTVGTNFIESACIVSTLGPMQSRDFDMRKAVEALPALKHVPELSFDCQCLMHTTTTVDQELLERLILSPLVNLRCLGLDNMSNRTDWAFLRKDWALRLRSLSVEAYEDPGSPEIDAFGQAEILEYCTDFVHVEKGKSKVLTISGWHISPEFLQRIVTREEGVSNLTSGV
ncbi:hypothetical protein AAVH_26742 [Aphelenchoides avenae]|nr:hypothetical protein AAVH_26742 [Aphelenchus avenae]